MSSLPSISPAASYGEATRLVVLIGHQSSVSPADLALSSAGLAELSFLADSGQTGEALLWQIARGVAPTTLVDFTDYPACLAAVRRSGATAVATFMDRWCALAARLNQALGADAGNQVQWGRKDQHRRILRAAGLSRIRSLVPTGRAELSAFADTVGFPLIVKPVDGFASRNTWLLESRHELEQLLDAPDFDLTGLYAEEFIRSCGPMVPGMADYVSVEVFRSGSAAGPAGSTTFITHRTPQAWPCRETGPILPSPLPVERQHELIAFTNQVLDALGGYRGMYHVEVKPSPSGLEVIEVNGRIGGYIAKAVHYGTGQDLARLGLASVLGQASTLQLDWQQCVYALLFQAPAAARRIVRSPSRRELRRLPGVIAIESVSAAGAEVHWRTGTLGLVASVWLTADDHTELHRRIVGVSEFLTDGFGYLDAADRPVQDRSWLAQLTAQDSHDSEVIG
jgi:biotin carboxylase